MKNKILLLSLMALPWCSQAQTSFAPVLGLNVSNYDLNYDLSYPTIPTTSRIGIRAGVIANTPISDHIYVQPGLYYVMNGFRVIIQEPFTTSFNINTLEIPINITVKTGKPNNNRFLISAGPYVGVNLWGRASMPGMNMLGYPTSTFSVPLRFGSEASNADFGLLDFGINANVGFELANGIIARAYYQKGIVAIQNIYSRNCGISLGYLIKTGSKKKVENKTN